MRKTELLNLALAYAAKLELAVKTLLNFGASGQIKNSAGWVPDVEKQKAEYQSAKGTKRRIYYLLKIHQRPFLAVCRTQKNSNCFSLKMLQNSI